ncbi:hypothetical protein BDQ17DRAFT_1439032 [Cyathus striatus]|nr:hypothetical protein BDQ17DRAFT_1439032 [Cyathus striatus]
MPHITEHQQHERALIEAFMVATVAEEEAQLLNLSSSESSSSSTSSSAKEWSTSASDSSNSSIPFHILDPLPDHIIHALEEFLVMILQDHAIFQNNSSCEQMPVEQQVAITLYRFHHYGNAASAMKVALWAGVSYGTVQDATL